MNFQTTQEPDNEELFVSPPFSRSNALYAGLHDMESLLRCHICHEFVSVPVTLLPCLHLFCSLCVRNAIKTKVTGMTRKAVCPVCRVECSSDLNKCLVRNPTVELLVTKYQQIRQDLARQLNIAAQVTNEEEEEEENSKMSATTASQEVVVEVDEQGEPKRRRTTRSLSSAATTATSSTVASLPSATNPPVKLKPKPTTHYNALKRKDLVALCAKEGLLTKGTDRELKARHEEFVRLWNAQCDSCFPLPASKLARQVNEQEKIRKNFARGSQADAAIMEQLKQNRIAMGKNDEDSGGMATSGNKDFDAKLKSGFDALIQGMKRPPRKREWVDTTPEAEEEENAAEESQGAHGSAEDSANETPATVAFIPANNGSEPPPLPPPQDSNVARAPPINPYASSATGTTSAQKEAKADKKESPTSVSDTKLSSASKEAPSAATSARKPARTAGLMTNFVTTTPAASKSTSPSSQQSTSSSSTSSSSRSSLIGPWTCHVCTLINTKDRWSRAKCEACGTQRLAPGDEAPAAKEENNMVLLDV